MNEIVKDATLSCLSAMLNCLRKQREVSDTPRGTFHVTNWTHKANFSYGFCLLLMLYVSDNSL
jgi:hypothetical protein